MANARWARIPQWLWQDSVSSPVLAGPGASRPPKGQGSPPPASAHGFWAGQAGRGVLALALLGPPSWKTAASCHRSSAPGHLFPPEVLPDCFIEFDIIRSIKVPKLLDHLGVYLHMSPAFGLAQAARQAAALRLFQARKAFCLVEVEVLVRDNPFDAQEVLDFNHLPGGVRDQLLPADKVDLGEGEVLQPALQVHGVHPDADGVPGGVHQPQAAVAEGQPFEGGDVRLLGERLRVV